MTIERANIAFEKGEAVIYKGLEYRCITAIIKRRKNIRSLRDRMTPQSRYTYSCEILDKNCGSVIVCLPDDIEPKHNSGESNENQT